MGNLDAILLIGIFVKFRIVIFDIVKITALAHATPLVVMRLRVGQLLI